MTKEHHAAYLAHTFKLCLEQVDEPNNEVISGQLASATTTIGIVGGIPRFAPSRNYADNFGLQWTTFRSTQLDSQSGVTLSADRLWASTKWSHAELRGKTVLEVGCGAGRFTEILLGSGARVVGVDYSNAVDANRENNLGKGDLFLIQADLHELPFPDECFDFVLCFGVLQHTPSPIAAYKAILRKLKPGGKLSLDCYRKRRVPTPWSTPKYLWRPITSKMSPERLLQIIRWYMPRYLPVDTFLRRLPWIGRFLVAIVPIPCWNYVEVGLSPQQRLEWAVMDTFDALGAAYDKPQTLDAVLEMIRSDENVSAEVFYGGNGIVANVVKNRSSRARAIDEHLNADG